MHVYIPALQLDRVIRIIQVIWVTFCLGQNGFHPDMLICLTRIKIVCKFVSSTTLIIVHAAGCGIIELV